MTTAAANPNGGAGIGAGLGMGMGVAMAQNLQNQMSPQMGPWGAIPAQPQATTPPPPPPPVEKLWHLAENGKTKGPFSRADLGRMSSEGKLTRDSLVWTAGQDGWKTADEIAELAQLFTIMPPPPPGA